MVDQVRRNFLTTAATLLTSAAVGCLSSGGGDSSLPFDNPTLDVSYNVVNGEDLSFQTGDGEVVRYSRSVRTTPNVSELNNDELETVSKALLHDMFGSGDEGVNAVMIYFIADGVEPGAGACATVEWAPDGQFSNANRVDSGDYGSFEFKVENNPMSCEPISTTA